MNSKARRRIGVVALAAFLTSSTMGIAGCGSSGGSAATDAAQVTATTAAKTQAVSSTSNWDSCRRGVSNDPYPGICHDYVDTNGDDICDLSQPDPNVSATAPGLAVATVAADAGATDAVSADPWSGDCPLGPCAVCGICSNLS